MILVDPVDASEGKNLEQFLSDFGIKLGSDVIVDKLSKLFGGDYLIPLVTDYKGHAITKGFRLGSFFPIARTVRKAEVVPANLEITELALTGKESWGELDLANLEDGKATYDKATDEQGPLSVAVAVTDKKTKGKLAVFGDSDFATNGFINFSGNKDFILNTIAWLSGDDILITIRPRQRGSTPIFLTEGQQEFLFYGPVLTPPLLFLMTGACVFFVRRRFN